MCLDLFLRWDLVEHVAKDLPRTISLLLPHKQVLAAEMDLLPVPRHVTFENRGRNRDVTHHVEAVPIERQRERHKVRIGDKLLVILADRGVLISAPRRNKKNPQNRSAWCTSKADFGQ